MTQETVESVKQQWHESEAEHRAWRERVIRTMTRLLRAESLERVRALVHDFLADES